MALTDIGNIEERINGEDVVKYIRGLVYTPVSLCFGSSMKNYYKNPKNVLKRAKIGKNNH